MEDGEIKRKREFVKDRKSNYMVLKGEGCERSYKNKMLAQYAISGFLKTESRSIDNMELYFYDITDLKSADTVFKNKTICFSHVKILMEGIFQTIDNSLEYFLEQDDFILHPDYIYMKEDLSILQLCYFPGYNESIVEQLSSLFEYIMNKANYQEEALVLLIYALYKKSSEKDTTLYGLKEVLVKYLPGEAKADTDKTFSFQAEEEKKETGWEKGDAKGKQKGAECKQKDIEWKPKGTEGKQKDIEWKLKGTEGKQKDTEWKSKGTERKQKDTEKKQKKAKREQKEVKWEPREAGPEKSALEWLKGRNGKCREEAVNFSGEYEEQEEISYYEIHAYILGGAALAVGVSVFIVLLQKGMLSDELGHPDIIRAGAALSTVLCLLGYIFYRIFDPVNKNTKVISRVAYEEPEEILSEEGFEKEQFGDVQFGKRQSEKEQLERIELEKRPYEKGAEEEWVTQLLFVSENETEILYVGPEEPFYYLIEKKNDNPVQVPVEKFPFYIGKDRTRNQLILAEKSVSRLHAVLTLRGKEVYLTDLGSTNGTFINGQKLEKNCPTAVSNSDEVAFAREIYLFKTRIF